MDILLQQIISGLASGAIYASVALALVMIYNTTGHINFAQGEMAMFSTYIAWALVTAGLPYWLAFVLTVAVSFAGGVLIERVVLRPLHNAPVMAIIVVFIGMLLAFNALAGWIWGFLLKEFPSPARAVATGTPLFGGHDLFILIVTLAELVLLFLFFRHTSLGLAMRAAAQNPASARLVGVRVGWMLALGWGMAAAIGAVAGMLVAPIVFLDPNMMAGILLYAFAAALLGGITSPGGAVAGGLIVGVMENLVGTFVIGNELKLTFALAIVICVLIFKPSGLFGKVMVKRV
ncbi:MAG: branched-chain amino acid ABC transporter permease [Alphaproteobacteria bacterium]|jgi:branched-chain amino acid transport system permease protein|nr:branched-chain amino acid ABC transporter permease [Alphaproteobacteria bacterium]